MKMTTACDHDFSSVLSSMVWNRIKPERIPDVIVSVANEQDIIEAVILAKKQGLKISVHGGGHTWCGLACEMVG